MQILRLKNFYWYGVRASGNCTNPECEKCSFFAPKVFGIRVSRGLGLKLFKLKERLDWLRRRSKIG